MKAPAFKMILTDAGEYAYRRPEDGIYVIPDWMFKTLIRLDGLISSWAKRM